MELRHRFTVPAPVAETWAAFNDVAQVAGCFPGASVTEVDGDEFKGSCKVKLGPIALVYTGSGRFVEKDQEAGRLVLEAKGKDKRGNGTAGAAVTATFTEVEDRTDVEVVTDLSITGKPAQFGRGVIQDVSDKLLGQFVDCLETRLVGPAAAEGGPSGSEEPAATAATAGTVPPGGQAAPHAVPPPSPQTAPAPPPGIASPPPPREEAQKADALDLGRTALPILLRAYWKQLAGLLALALLVRWVTRRR